MSTCRTWVDIHDPIILTDPMLMTVAKNHNVWVVEMNKLETGCRCFWWHASNVQQQDLPSTEMKQPQLWNVACLVVHIASAPLQCEP